MYDIPRWLADNGISFKHKGTDNDGREIYVLQPCPFNPDHVNSDAAILVNPEGPIGFKCFHDSCSHYTWKDVKKQIGGFSPSKYALTGSEQPTAKKKATKAKPFSMEVKSLRDLWDMDLSIPWLVENVLSENQQVIVGSHKKSMKTSMILDLSVCLGTGTPWLGKFKIPKKKRVLFISAEWKERRTISAIRSMAESKGYTNPDDINVLLSFRSPKLGIDEHLEIVCKEVRDNAIDVLVIDPAYLSLAGADMEASNIFSMADPLGRIGDMGSALGITIILIHHFRKAKTKKFEKPSLDDLTYSGFAEWARQWILLARYKSYKYGSGHHDIYFNYGGSDGQGGEEYVHINEGDTLTGPIWDVKITTPVTPELDKDLDQEVPKEDPTELLERVYNMIMSGRDSKHKLKTDFDIPSTKLDKLIQELLDTNRIVEKKGRYTTLHLNPSFDDL